METILFYTGKGYMFIPGVPARDLTQADIRASGFTAEQLLAYGCYARAAEKPSSQPTGTVIIIEPADGISHEEARGAGQALRQRRAEQEKK